LDLVGLARSLEGGRQEVGRLDRGRLRPLLPTQTRYDQERGGFWNPPTGSSPTDFGGCEPERRGPTPCAKPGQELDRRLPTQKIQGKGVQGSAHSRLHRYQKSIALIGTFDDWKSAIFSSQDRFLWTRMQVRSIIIARVYFVDWGKCPGGWRSSLSKQTSWVDQDVAVVAGERYHRLPFLSEEEFGCLTNTDGPFLLMAPSRL
jgi:hypothetical protein